MSMAQQPAAALIPTPGQGQLPQDYADQLAEWNTLSIRWWIVHYILGILGILVTGLGAPKEGGADGWTQMLGRGFSIGGAILVGIIAFFRADIWATSYRRAWSVLFEACDLYKTDPAAKVADLHTAWKRGRGLRELRLGCRGAE